MYFRIFKGNLIYLSKRLDMDIFTGGVPLARIYGKDGDFNAGEYLLANALKDHLDDRHIF